jgi:adenosylmethionine-8-amino-7-oxononanoate aminotransferase
VVEQYGATLAERLPMSDASIFPVSGGSEAVETALKVARAYHLANDQADRTIVIGRDLSYHGNTRGALDVSGRQALRAPYLPWLSHSGRVPGVLEYRCPNPAHPDRCAHWHAGALQQEIARLGPERVAAFIAEPVGGAASGAAVPPDGYWEAIAEVCATHGVLIIADEVMTGFGRTGRWFAAEHFGLRPDIVTMAKGAASGYWPLGICALSGKVTAALDEGLIHGFTFSHHLVGAAAGLAVLRVIDEMGLVGQADERGRALRRALDAEIGSHPAVGDIRGIGLMLAIELVADKGSKRPFPRSAGMAERLTSLAKQEELLVYPSTGSAGDGTGDLIMIGPPLTIEMDEIDQLVTRLARALERLR